jgi:ligand-binding SRPBCC domain-containing protein
MPYLEFESVVRASLQAVWNFHQDVQALAKVTPPEMRFQILRVDQLPPRVGTTLDLCARVPLRGTVKWVGRYVEHRPPHAVACGQAAWFVDEQVSGPFKRWVHRHEFQRIDETHTRIIDVVDYSVPLGLIGWLADVLFVRRSLKRMFAHRHQVMRGLMESPESAHETAGAASDVKPAAT